MTRQRLSLHHLAASWLIVPALLVAQLVAAPLAAQQACGNTCSGHCGFAACGAPAWPVPQSYWGELQSVDPPCTQLPAARDSSYFSPSANSYPDTNFWMNVDIQNNFVFAAMGYGLQIWDTTANPASPTMVGSLNYSRFPFFPAGVNEVYFPIAEVSAPSGVDSMVGLSAVYGGIGVAIADTSSKTQPRIAYQAQADLVSGVYATTIGGTHYLFVAAQTPGGVYLLNMDRAVALASCLDNLQTPNGRCPGVNLGAVLSNYPYGITGVDKFIALTSSTGVAVYDVSNPMSPQLKASGLSSSAVAVAMWKGSAGNYYVAARAPNPGSVSDTLYIYDVSCATGGSCSGLGTLLSQTTFQESTPEGMFLSYSNSNGTPFLYLGRDSTCAAGQQQEWLLNVSNPSAPRDVSPQTGYWGWYYSGNSTGFNNFQPRAGKFNGSYFYRAGFTTFDIHKWVSVVAPTAAFTWSPTAPIYPGTQVTFNSSQSSGNQLTYSWNFGDGTPATSSQPNPTVTFPAHGSYPFNEAVSLTVKNNAGTSTANQNVTLSNPAAQISSISVSPANPLQCQQVTLTANATGQAPLAYSWNIVNSSNQPALGGTSTANPFPWNSAMSASGTYTAGVTVSNGAAGPATLQQAFTLGALPTLAASGSFTPTDSGTTTGTVQFNVVASGATSWNWNFGDNPGGGPNHDGYVGWSTDPVAGPAPIHNYTSTGLYPVTVEVRNCVNLGPATSAVHNVNITQVTPLVAGFTPGCFTFPCTAIVNTPVNFTDTSTGSPTTWDYDWDGSGAFLDAGHTAAVTQHTYTTSAFYKPAVRVNRGNQTNTYVFSTGISVVSASPPAISVSGGSQGVTGTVYTFSAFASNCTAAASGWSWSTGGGSGSSTSFSIAITWANPGTYLVSASNSGCSGVTGSASIVITSSGGGGGTLKAAFSFSPTSPTAGSKVAFDGSASTGATSYSWFFGDGATASGVTASHAYSQAGTYTVKLDAAAPGNCQGGVCIDEAVQAVTVGGGGGGGLKAAFSFSPTSPTAGGSVAFDGSASTGATSYSWFFGDGATASGATASHAYSQAGTYTVKLDAAAPGNCQGGVCIDEAVQTVTVLPNTSPTLSGGFTSPACAPGTNICSAAAGASVALTAVDARGTTYAWDFGDGTTGSGPTVTHSWSTPRTYKVGLTVSGTGYTPGTGSQSMVITAPVNQSVVLPWVAATRGALVQSCDLYLHNPGANPLPVTLQFLKRGAADPSPPQATAVIQPGATMYAPDVLQSVFTRDNIAGFVTVTVKSTDPLPVMTSFNTVTRTDGSQFGQTVPGLAMPAASTRSSGTGSTFQYLTGLNDNSDELAYFGITNPTPTTATYHVRLFDTSGNQIGESNGDLTVGAFGQRQFQQADVHNLFGLTTATDYMVSIENKSGNSIFPYGENVRMGSGDPSFVTPGATTAATQYVIGAFSSNGSWQTDVVLANTGTQPMVLSLTFTKTGVLAPTTAPVTVTLNPGATQRLSNAIAGKWNLSNVVGVITVISTGANGVYPIVQAESYNNAQPANRFGQSMAAFSDANAAKTGQTDYLVGLRQDATHLSTVWVFNNSTTYGIYDIVYRGLDGAILGTLSNLTLPPGKVKGIAPAQHPLPAGGVTNGFTVQVVVKNGTALSAAQVLTTSTGDPAYVQGVAR